MNLAKTFIQTYSKTKGYTVGTDTELNLESLENHVERSYISQMMSELELDFDDAAIHYFVEKCGDVSEQLRIHLFLLGYAAFDEVDGDESISVF